MRLVIVGASDAGIAAGLRATEVDPRLEVTIFAADAYPNFSICGLPYWVGGEVGDWRSLAHRTRGELSAAGLALRLDEPVAAVDAAARHITLASGERAGYDRLIIATGAHPVRPRLPGLDLPGVHPLHTMGDAFTLDASLTERDARSAVIVGAGYIGLEMAEALVHRGLAVTVVEQVEQPLPTVDPELGRLVREQLTDNGVEVRTGTVVEAIEAAGAQLTVSCRPGETLSADIVLVSVGVRPSSELAEAAGARLGGRGAIDVSPAMKTSLPDVWAAGDCVHTHHRLLRDPAYMPLGTTAHKQGRVAGENAAGGDRSFAGSLGTQVVKVFELAVARTGLRDDEARDAGYAPVTGETEAPDHKRYYPGAHDLAIRLTADSATGRILGCQLAGHLDGQVAKRIDIAAAAIFSELGIEEVADLDLSYTPPFGSPWDALQVAALEWPAAAPPARAAA